MDGGGGFLTSRLTTWSWRGVMATVGRSHHHTLSLFGPFVLVSVVVFWVLLLWAGWVLIYASDPDGLLHTRDPGGPADWTGRIWFVAYAISTMGNGDHTPNGDVWQIVASLTTLSGFFLATLVISYILSVLGAVVEKRAFASGITGMGQSPAEYLTNGWDGQSFRSLDLQLNMVAVALGTLTEQYLSYPVLQYYHGARAAKSPAIGLAILDEALTLLRFGIPAQHRPSVAVLHAARGSVAGYLETLGTAFIDPADATPPPPDLEKLRAAGIPTVSDAEFAAALEDLEERRRKVHGLLLADGWTWGDW